MAKEMSKDSQILINMMMVQKDMNAIIDKYETVDLVAEDKDSVNLLAYYIIRLFSMRKNFSGKTKKELHFFNENNYTILSKHLISCFPLMSDKEIVLFAKNLCDDDANIDLLERYKLCIAESLKYGGES